MKEIRKCFVNGDATKDDFEKALRAHKEAKDEMKSDQREAAAAARHLNECNLIQMDDVTEKWEMFENQGCSINSASVHYYYLPAC